MKQFKVAVIGAGFMAKEHIKAFGDIPEIKIIGIYSRTRSRAVALAQNAGIPYVYDTIEGLYEGTRADLVIIAVPELSSNEVCREAFKYPWQALIEKPAGYNLNDAEDISAAANKAGCRAYVAMNRRHYSSTRAVIQELVAVEGPRLVQVHDQENPQVALDGGQPALVVQNWMYANSIHLIDYFSIFCRGELTDVDHVIKWNPEDPRYVLTKLQYSSGDIGVYHAVWNGPGPWGVSVTTQPKRWEMRPLEQAASQAYKSRQIDLIPVHDWDIKFKSGLRQQAAETVKALRGELSMLPTLLDGISTMNLVKKIYEA